MRIGISLCGAMACALLASTPSTRQVVAAEAVRPVPLGGILGGQTGDQSYGVYVPTRHGGMLAVRAGTCTIEALTGPDGRPRVNGQEVGGADAHGWYTFKVTGTEPGKSYAVETAFVQVGQATRMPWNYYYWPTKGDSIHEPWSGGNGRVDTMSPAGDDIMVAAYGAPIAPGQDIILPGPNGLLESRPAPGDTSTWFPNLYDDLTFLGADGVPYQTPAPLLKYDQLFGLSARSWEAAYSQTQGIQRWPGHCLGGAIASIMLDEPRPAPGSGLSRDELKALWAELGENHLNHRIGDNANNIPAGPPRPGSDPCDLYVPRFHAMLERHIRARKQALLANLRAFPPTGGQDEVWNHGVGKYTARFHVVPGAGARRVRIELELFANTGSNLNDQDAKPRHNTYEYILVYGADGEVDETAVDLCDWMAVGGDAMFAPLNILEVAESRWQGHNPLVTEANVRALDATNGSSSKFTGTPPVFRPVATNEASQAPLAFPPMVGGDSTPPRMADGTPAPPRRGLFRFGRD
ncbi:hypothetical protein [Singulisphaera acidiphila]|uniref:Uncharacterized protein n=1 Tax=Singulisphaera acidiphila (strain ATCC BAA-1392 / DSM 18658 / VKM B-2454 / MOB10) TaxID=886293 RepID=L0DGK2_SINAD|nr:hypothetical protein [Singulisphaera acidiphila]AGA27980.1 hypothetical protein Sinac_3742 [Singulisphaera acidiphila DSM 18658]